MRFIPTGGAEVCGRPVMTLPVCVGRGESVRGWRLNMCGHVSGRNMCWVCAWVCGCGWVGGEVNVHGKVL